MYLTLTSWVTKRRMSKQTVTKMELHMGKVIGQDEMACCSDIYKYT